MNDQTTKSYEPGLAGRRFDVSRLGQRLACRLFYAWLRYRQWRREHEAIRHLRQIDDRLLDDVGIERREIDDAVRGRSGYQANAHQNYPVPSPRIDPCGKMAA